MGSPLAPGTSISGSPPEVARRVRALDRAGYFRRDRDDELDRAAKRRQAEQVRLPSGRHISPARLRRLTRAIAQDGRLRHDAGMFNEWEREAVVLDAYVFGADDDRLAEAMSDIMAGPPEDTERRERELWRWWTRELAGRAFPRTDAMWAAAFTDEAGLDAGSRERLDSRADRPVQLKRHHHSREERVSHVGPSNLDPEPAWAERIITKMAVGQVMAVLDRDDPAAAKALRLLAEHRTQGEAQRAGGYSAATYNRLIRRARERFALIWYWPETPPSGGYVTVKGRTGKSSLYGKDRKGYRVTDWGDRAMLADAYGWQPALRQRPPEPAAVVTRWGPGACVDESMGRPTWFPTCTFIRT